VAAWIRAVTWNRRYRLRRFARDSLWLLPLVGLLGGLALSLLAAGPGERLDTPSGWHYSPDTAQAVLTAVVGASVSLTGFVVTVSVLVVQLATGTFSARTMRVWYRDRLLKAVLAVLVGTFMFSYSLLRRLDDSTVPDLGVALAGVLMGVGLLLFLLFLNRFVHHLRPVALASLVAAAGQRALHAQASQAGRPAAVTPVEAAAAGNGGAVAVRAAQSGVIQAIHVEGLVGWAEQRDCVLSLHHPVGDFVTAGTRLLDVHGARVDAADERALDQMLALGVERTIEHDPAFAIRIMVDIANRALSPAVNDPTTAVQVLDHLEATLLLIGRTPNLGQWSFRDGADRLRLLVPAPRWEDYVALTVTEIRLYGAGSMQVVRRLRALLEALREAVLPEHVAAVEEELARLDADVALTFGESPDLDRARTADRQGIGGPFRLGTPAATDGGPIVDGGR
jgi:uncharacterized membrane protein